MHFATEAVFLISILCAVAWMYFTAQALSVSHVFCFFTAPFTSVIKRPPEPADGDESVKTRTDQSGGRGTASQLLSRFFSLHKFRGVFSLAALYFFTAFAVALTSGHIGIFHQASDPVRQEDFLWGFSIGLLVVALARIASVYRTTRFAEHL